MKYTKYPELKAELKALAKEIRQWKSWRKPINRRGTDLQQWDVDFKVFILKREFRHRHIAYCMLRGRTYEQIENYCHEAPDFDKIEHIRGLYAEKTLCAGA